MIRAIAIDDEPPALKIIENFCKKADFIHLEKSFTRPSEAFTYIGKSPVELLFLDIQMPTISGIDFYKSITKEIMVIFTTAYSQYAAEGFNVNAIDYLVKPYSFERFLKAVKKADDYFGYLNRVESSSTPYIYIRADYNLIKLNLQDIKYIQGLDDYAKFHLEDDRIIVSRMTMKSIMEKLPSREFIRVHRSFIVPKSKVDRIRNKILMIGDVEIPVGTSYEQNYIENFKNHGNIE